MFLNPSKLERATDVVRGRGNFDAESVEKTALALATQELEGSDLKGKEKEEALIKAVYIKLGGAIRGDAAANAEAEKVGIISEESSGKATEEIGKPRRSRKS